MQLYRFLVYIYLRLDAVAKSWEIKGKDNNKSVVHGDQLHFEVFVAVVENESWRC